MGSRGVHNLCVVINSVNWLMTRLIRNKYCFCIHNAKTGAVSAQLMSARKIVGKSRFLPSSMSVHSDLSPTWAKFRSKDILSRFGAQ